MTQNWGLVLSSDTSFFYSTMTAEAGFNKGVTEQKKLQA
jgi:hypothetical protein